MPKPIQKPELFDELASFYKKGDAYKFYSKYKLDDESAPISRATFWRWLKRIREKGTDTDNRKSNRRVGFNDKIKDTPIAPEDNKEPRDTGPKKVAPIIKDINNTDNTDNTDNKDTTDNAHMDTDTPEDNVVPDNKPKKFIFDVTGINNSGQNAPVQNSLESTIGKLFETKEPSHVRVDLSIVGKSVAKAEDFVYTKYADKPLTETERQETIEAFNVEMNERFRVVSKYAPEINIATTIGSHAIERIHLPNKNRSAEDNGQSGDNNLGRAFRLNQNGEIIGYA